MPAQLVQDALGVVSGSLVGFTLGLVGGGGSILAVPLMVYLVGVPSAHVAIGTSALAVATNAAANLVSHSRMGTVKWRCAATFAAAGVLGAYLGSSLSKIIDGQKLLLLFALLMLIVAGIMFVRRAGPGDAAVRLNRENGPWLLAVGFMAGALSGFFGIGGGFLIVPGLIFASGMPIFNAIGSSLVGVAAFGTTAALNYAASGFVDWRLAAVFIGGGIAGGLIGGRVARKVGEKRGALNVLLATIISLVAIYMLVMTLSS